MDIFDKYKVYMVHDLKRIQLYKQKIVRAIAHDKFLLIPKEDKEAAIKKCKKYPYYSNFEALNHLSFLDQYKK